MVEESEVIGLLTSHLLAAQRFEVTTAENAPEGWARAIVFLPDLVLIDEVMQGENGHQLIARLADDPRLREVPIVLLVTEQTLPQNPHCVRLPKPFTPVALREAVDRAFALGPAASASGAAASPRLPPSPSSPPPSNPRSGVGTKVARARPSSIPVIGGRCLVAVGGELVGRRYPLYERLTIGRDPSCDIIVNEDSVSRLHGELVVDRMVTLYRDTSSNGTLVSSDFVRGREVSIRSGDSIQVGGTVLRYLRGDDLERLVDAEMARVEVERRASQRAMERFVSTEAAAMLDSGSHDVAQHGARQAKMSVLFSDLRGFTSISEVVEPLELAAFLREYFETTTNTILDLRGYVDKFLGDGLMAFWGAPRDDAEHATHACMASLALRDLVATSRPRWRERFGVDIHSRVGVNTGDMLIGDFGPPRKVNFTVISDAVNLASRLEGANKTYGTELIVSQATLEATRGAFEARELDRVVVRGREAPVTIYELVAPRGQLRDAQRTAFDHFARGLAFYRDADRASAAREFLRVLDLLPEDGPAQEYFRPCAAHGDGESVHRL